MFLQRTYQVYIPARDNRGDTKDRIKEAFNVDPEFDHETNSYIVNGKTWRVEPELNKSGKVTYYVGEKIVATCIDDGNGRVMFSVQ